ncbi:MAG: hypothetical protein LBF51_04765 [Zoogloeaceae bacterium]|jgi:hypothetical protein|nr:hypothetical protein [Zoogloeaceae bacterium]
MSILKNVIIGLDQTVNCLIRLDGEWGSPDETLSARAWRVRAAHPAWAKWIDRFFFWETSHCEASWQSELLRAHLPKGYRSGSGAK